MRARQAAVAIMAWTILAGCLAPPHDPAPVAPAATSAAPPDGLAVLAEDRFDGPGFVVLQVQTNGSQVALFVNASSERTPTDVGEAVLHGNGTRLGMAFATQDFGATGAFVSSDAAGLRQDATQPVPGRGGGSIAMTLDDPGAKTRQVGVLDVVVWAGSQGALRWNLTLRGAPGVALLRADRGNASILLDERDFSGGADAEGFAPVPEVSGVGARAGVQMARTVHLNHTFLGFYLPYLGAPGAQELGVRDASGQARDCGTLAQPGCLFGSGAGPDALGPGDAAFTWSGAAAGQPYDASILLGGVDAPLPPG